ncbi:MAG: hypothetical protein WCQ99_13435, partial [Pseudomonadota bacterium]
MDEKKMQSVRKKYKEKKVGVLMGGMSSERTISRKSGRAILNALLRKGYAAVVIEADARLGERLQQEHIDIAF